MYEAATVEDIYHLYNFFNFDDDHIFTCIGISGEACSRGGGVRMQRWGGACSVEAERSLWLGGGGGLQLCGEAGLVGPHLDLSSLARTYPSSHVPPPFNDYFRALPSLSSRHRSAR